MWNYLLPLMLVTPLWGELVPLEIKKFIKDDERLTLKSDNNKITFEWMKEPKASFILISEEKLNQVWWLVFNEKSTEIAFPKTKDLPKGVLSIKPMPHDKYTILEVKLHDHFSVSFLRENALWTIEVTEKAHNSRIATTQAKEETLKKQSLFLESGKWPTAKIAKASHKEILALSLNGITIHCVLSDSPDQGLNEPHETPYYIVLESKLGAGIQLYSPLVSLDQKGNDITISVNTDLKGVSLKDKKEMEFPAQVGLFKNYSRETLLDYLQHPKPLRSLDYLERAWVELMIGNERQALTYAQLFEEAYPGASHHPFVRALKAASHIMDHSFAKADKAISFLPQTSEIRLLKGVILSAEGFPIGQINNLRKILLIYKNYSQNLREELMVPILMALLDAGDFETILTLIKNIAIPENEKFAAYFKYCNAIASIKKNVGTGQAELVHLQENYGKLTTQLQAYLKYYQLSKAGLNDDELIEKLINLSYMWRGDQFEFMILYQIMTLHAKNKKYDEALFMLKRIRDYFPNTYEILHLEKEMISCFSNFFKGDIKHKSPLKIISLYEEFRDCSEKTDTIRFIANLMIDQDLLDQAAELLSKATKDEKDPAALSDLCIKVASIHIANRNGEAALSMLEKVSKWPDVLLLKARAYAVMGKLNIGLGILQKENTIESLKLATDLLIAEKKWDEARSILFDLLLKLEDVKHKEVKADAIMTLAMVNILTDMPHENQALYIVHGNFFSNVSKEKQEIFSSLVNSPEMFVIDRDSVEEQLKSVGELDKLYKFYQPK